MSCLGRQGGEGVGVHGVEDSSSSAGVALRPGREGPASLSAASAASLSASAASSPSAGPLLAVASSLPALAGGSAVLSASSSTSSALAVSSASASASAEGALSVSAVAVSLRGGGVGDLKVEDERLLLLALLLGLDLGLLLLPHDEVVLVGGGHDPGLGHELGRRGGADLESGKGRGGLLRGLALDEVLVVGLGRRLLGLRGGCVRGGGRSGGLLPVLGSHGLDRVCGGGALDCAGLLGLRAASGPALPSVALPGSGLSRLAVELAFSASCGRDRGLGPLRCAWGALVPVALVVLGVAGGAGGGGDRSDGDRRLGVAAYDGLAGVGRGGGLGDLGDDLRGLVIAVSVEEGEEVGLKERRGG